MLYFCAQHPVMPKQKYCISVSRIPWQHYKNIAFRYTLIFNHCTTVNAVFLCNTSSENLTQILLLCARCIQWLEHNTCYFCAHHPVMALQYSISLSRESICSITRNAIFLCTTSSNDITKYCISVSIVLNDYISIKFNVACLCKNTQGWHFKMLHFCVHCINDCMQVNTQFLCKNFQWRHSINTAFLFLHIKWSHCSKCCVSLHNIQWWHYEHTAFLSPLY